MSKNKELNNIIETAIIEIIEYKSNNFNYGIVKILELLIEYYTITKNDLVKQNLELFLDHINKFLINK